MRAFAKPSGLMRLSLEARIVYTGFCVFMLVGYGSAAWFYADDHLDASAQSARTYYLGEDPAPSAPAVGGPALELPPVPDTGDEIPVAASYAFAKSPRQVMETFHFHLFSVSVCLLIVAHLFMMCALPTSLKAAVVALAWVATLAHLLAPPLIRLVSPSFARLMFPSALSMSVTWLALTAWPLWEMWRRPSPRKAQFR